MNVGRILRQLREMNHLSQKVIADYLGIKVNSYCQYETGKRLPSLLVIEKLSQAYYVPADIFFFECIEMFDFSQDKRMGVFHVN